MRLVIVGDYSLPADYDLLVRTVTAGQKPELIISGEDNAGERLAQQFGIPYTRFGPSATDPTGAMVAGDMVVYASDVPGSAVVALDRANNATARAILSIAETYEVRAVPLDPMPSLIPTKNVTPEPFIFKQSYSSLEVFKTCPRQYHAKYITREVKWVQSAKAKWGDDVHLALEQFLLTKGAATLPANMSQYQGWGAHILDRAARFGGHVIAERKAAVGKDYLPRAYSDKSGWLGGKIDVTIIYPAAGTAEVFDWKTGKVKNDTTQLKLYSGFTLADYPEVHTVRSAFIWLEHKQISPPTISARADLAGIWAVFQHDFDRLKDAYVRGSFPPTPNGLCKQWCDVVNCEFHGRGR